MTSTDPMPVVVLISGSGSNLQALIDGASSGFLPIELRAVISNESTAFGLERAARAGIETHILDHRAFADRASYDADLSDLIDRYRPGLVVLAGFMRILTPALVRRYRGRMFNIHPSLLPKLRGLHTHRRALEGGERVHGASVHFVTEELDGGPLVLQTRVAVLPGDDPETLAARVLQQEHKIYPLAVRWYAQGRLSLGDDGVPRLDGRPIPEPPILESLPPDLLS